MQNSIQLSGRISDNVAVTEDGKTTKFSIYRTKKIENADEGEKDYEISFIKFFTGRENRDLVRKLDHRTMIDIVGHVSFYKTKKGKMIQRLVADEIIVRS